MTQGSRCGRRSLPSSVLQHRAGDLVPADARPQREHGHGRQCPGDGLRQHGRRQRHRRRLHPQSEHRRAGSLRRVPANAQGEDVVAGVRTPRPISEMAERSGLPRGLHAAAGDRRPARSPLHATCRTSSSRSSEASSGCCRPAPASGPRRPPCGSPSIWPSEG